MITRFSTKKTDGLEGYEMYRDSDGVRKTRSRFDNTNSPESDKSQVVKSE
jgi:hypothetical protein